MDTAIEARVAALELLLERALHVETQLRPDFHDLLATQLERQRRAAAEERDGVAIPADVFDLAANLLADSRADPPK